MRAWARKALKEDGAERVEAAVRAAEKRTRAEIVPVLARRSAGMRHVPVLAAALLLLLLQLSGWSLWRPWLPWGHGAVTWLDALSAGVLAWALARSMRVQRWLTPDADLQESAERAALNAFHAHSLDGTDGRHGVLLYVSLAEHRAVVLADKAIAARLPASTWDEVCGLILEGAAAGDLAGGYEKALSRCAEILARPFPPKRRNPNELKDRLRIVEGPGD